MLLFVFVSVKIVHRKVQELSAYIRQFDSHLLKIDKYKRFCVLIRRTIKYVKFTFTHKSEYHNCKSQDSTFKFSDPHLFTLFDLHDGIVGEYFFQVFGFLAFKSINVS